MIEPQSTRRAQRKDILFGVPAIPLYISVSPNLHDSQILPQAASGEL